MITFHPATEADAQYVGRHLRRVDRIEIERGSGDSPSRAPLDSLLKSTIAWTMKWKDVPVAVFGVASSPQPGAGIVWLLGTPGVDRGAKAMVQQGRYYVDLMQRLYPVLFNAIDPTNTSTRRWLRALGFTEGAPLVSRMGYEFLLISKGPNV